MANFSLSQVLGFPLPRVEIVDVGAAQLDTPLRYASLVEQDLASVTGFEPNAEELARLTQGAGSHQRFLPCFLGRGGPAIFHVTRFPGCSSIYEPDPSLIDLFSGIGTEAPTATRVGGNYFVEDTYPIETQRLDDVVECPPPDYLKLDVQGAELDVLVGATRALGSALVIEAEVELVPLYKGQPLLADVQRFLGERGFLVHALLDPGRRALRPILPGPGSTVGQLLWADALFVRDLRGAGAWTLEQLLKASLVLHEVYAAHDLVLHLLRAYDAKTGGTVASAYLDAMRRDTALAGSFSVAGEELTRAARFEVADAIAWEVICDDDEAGESLQLSSPSNVVTVGVEALGFIQQLTPGRCFTAGESLAWTGGQDWEVVKEFLTELADSGFLRLVPA